ncbi:hypothetical protein VNI00_001093 [Paramarasmius palmivorus]|uniref:Ig-like domain-containing protein n=1 Tax=Paramarasmius palmivorus TaxID=297713 RepID=A0AAW0EAI6_9AGAR
MLGLRACRSTLRAVTKIPTATASYSQNAPLPSVFGQTSRRTPGKRDSAVNDLLDDIEGPEASPMAQPTKSTTTSERPRYRLHCSSERSSTIVTFTRPNGETITWNSGGSVGYKGANRQSFEAGYQCAVRTFKTVEEVAKKEGPFYIDLYLKGFGHGRDAMEKALQLTEGGFVRPLVITITDRTPIKIGGTRSQKPKYR